MGILIFKGLTARRLYKSFGVKGLNMTKIMGTLREDLCALMTMPRSVLVKMRNVSDKLRNQHNQLDTDFTFTYALLRFKVSTCFGHYLPIFRRHYTNANLVTIV
jgi:hypothetical protein